MNMASRYANILKEQAAEKPQKPQKPRMRSPKAIKPPKQKNTGCVK